ncbi:efflux RND transporter permease subunit [Sulfurimonas sp. HSL-1716]|uniref:efflux RND transporter permease subunit n=1 Tax=Hydrocurvibacter sulfurireducens TaxID=3131937 RepID=UPI0031F84491
MIENFYKNRIIKFPKITLFVLFCIVTFLAFYIPRLSVDASAETLLLENDKDLIYTREINSRYDAPDFLVITYTPDAPLLSEKSLKNLKSLKKDLQSLNFVDNVVSILDVPLFKSPSKPLKELIQNIPTLESNSTDRNLAKAEFLSNPIYKNNLVGKDFITTAVVVNLKEDKRYKTLLDKKNATKKASDIKAFKDYREIQRAREHLNLQEIRDVMQKHSYDAQLFLGGVDMIADDMITYVKSDIKTYGSIVLVILLLMLYIVFRELKWVVIPIVISTASIVASTGLFGLLGFEVTVVSSNFISLQLIVTISIIIHLMVRYRELFITRNELSQEELILQTVTSILKPSFFAIITTIAGFSSLVFSGILPVIMLGWMMSLAITVSLIVIFLSFPAMLVLMKKSDKKVYFKTRVSLTALCSHLVEKHKKSVVFFSMLIFGISILYTFDIRVENSFINYFKKSTEIYKGMEVIDRSLGGTTPLDVIIDFPKPKDTPKKTVKKNATEDEFDEFEDEYNAIKNQNQYWFSADKMDVVRKVHSYLESIPEIGKVLSLGSVLELGRSLNDNKDLDDFALAMLYNELPQRFRKIVLSPYVNIKANQVRFSMRIVDSNPKLKRDRLLKKIKYDLVHKLGLKKENVHLSNLMVLYNNMLQSLFNSQIKTLGLMLVLLGIVFFILFRSWKVMLIAMIVNVIPISLIFGVMGYLDIPLDMMSITIASIAIGIAVDDTIHYLHRYKKEYAKDHDYVQAMKRSHQSVGYAMYYTSITIMIGFLVLVLSEFTPTIYFGLLTVLAMFSALVTDLLLLPALLLLVKPYKK